MSMGIKSKNLHLLVSTAVMVPIAGVYGLFPSHTLPPLFDFDVTTPDLKQVFRATMGLYCAMAALWIAGISKPDYWKMATVSNICFMGGLVIGRCASLILDGIPSMYFITGLLLESIFFCWGLWNVKYIS